MRGERWGWVAFIAALAILVATQKEEGPSACRKLVKLQKEIKIINHQREQALRERDDARQWASDAEDDVNILAHRLTETQNEVVQLKKQQETLQQEMARLSTDRSQLQQTISSLQSEREQTKRSVEQLRQGLQQLLSQAEAVSASLARPAPGISQVFFGDEEIDIAFDTSPAPVFKPETSEDIPLNKKP